MISIYMDERIEEDPDKVKFIVSSFVLGACNIADLRQAFLKIMQVRKRRRIEKLITLIEKWQSTAIITYSNIPQDMARAGKLDATLDIPKMNRRDNIWAQCILYNPRSGKIFDESLYYEGSREIVAMCGYRKRWQDS